MSDRPIHAWSLCFTICLAAMISWFTMQCTRTDYNNPLDPRSPDYVGDLAAQDADGDGIANLYDPDSPLYHVNDTIAPVLTVSGGDSIIIAQGDPDGRLRSLTITAIDETDGDLSDSVIREGVFFTSKCSTFTVTYSVHDGAGNSTGVAKTVVVDCEAPLIVLAGDDPLFVDVGQPFIDPGATATDNLDGAILSGITVSGTVVTSAEGVDTLVYSVMDRAGNTATKARIVKIQPGIPVGNHPPVIVLLGNNPMTLQQGRPYVEPGATASDAEDGDLTDSIRITGTVLSTRVGVDTITYAVADRNGGTDTTVRVVRVVDTTQGDTDPPWIELKGDAVMTLTQGGTYAEPGFTAGDAKDGDLTSRVQVSGSVTTSTPGTYVVTYSVSDAAGNPTSATRIVHVVAAARDTIPPSLTLNGCASCSVEVGTKFVDPGCVAVDGVDGVISANVARTIKNPNGSTVDSSALSGIGVYTLTYAVSDKAGNAAVPVSRVLHVLDTAGASGDLLKKYGVPAPASLGSISKTYTIVTTDGTINKGSIKSLQFQWSLERNVFDYIAFETTDGVPNYHVPLAAAVTSHLNSTGPWLELRNSGFPQLDGDYYVTGDATRLVWVKKDGSGALIFQ